MADIYLVQKGDLNPADFTNNNTNNRGGIGIRISPDSGNLLQKRPTGLYYGVEAPPDTRNLYVSSSTGDDANKGTRTSPLRTIREAIIRNNVGTAFNIHLFEDDVHDILASWGRVGNGKLMTFRPYGPVFDSVALRNPRSTWELYRSEDLHRPRVRIIADASFYDGNTQTEVMGLVSSLSPSTGHISSLGIHWDLTAEADLAVTHSNQQLFGHDVNTSNVGCVFELGKDFYFHMVGSNNSVSFDSCKVITTKGNKLLGLAQAGSLSLYIAGTGKSGQVSVSRTPPNQTPLTYLQSSTLEELNSTLHLGDKSTIVTTERVFSNVNLG